jgi:hypothetical protein
MATHKGELHAPSRSICQQGTHPHGWFGPGQRPYRGQLTVVAMEKQRYSADGNVLLLGYRSRHRKTVA